MHMMDGEREQMKSHTHGGKGKKAKSQSRHAWH